MSNTNVGKIGKNISIPVGRMVRPNGNFHPTSLISHLAQDQWDLTYDRAGSLPI